MKAMRKLKKSICLFLLGYAIFSCMSRVCAVETVEERVAYFLNKLKENPTDYISRTQLGTIYMDNKQYEKALECFREAIKRKNGITHDSIAYSNIGIVYLRQNKTDEAIAWFKEGIRQAPDAANNYSGLAECYRSQGNYEEAKKWFSFAQGKDVRFACPYQGLGIIYKKQNKPAVAEEYIKKEIEAKPKHWKGYYDLASYYFETGALEKAEQSANTALQHLQYKEQEKQVLELKGFIAVAAQEYDNAKALFENIINLYGNSQAALAGLGHIYNAQKNYIRAESYLKQAIEMEGNWREMAFLGLGWVAANQTKHQEALAYFFEILKENPVNLLALVSAGNAYNALGEYPLAEEYLKKALTISNDNEYALAELGMVYLNTGKTEEALTNLQKALSANNANYSCPYEGLGLLYLRQGDAKSAERYFQKAIEINPGVEYKKYNGLAKIYIQKGDLEEAKKLLRKSIENYPYDSEAKQLLETLNAQDIDSK